MKAKVLVVALCLMMGLVGTANAAFTYYTCTISVARVTGAGSPYITVTDTAATPAFTNNTFILDNSANQANASLAAALTAWSTGGKVVVFADSANLSYGPAFSVACTN
jgi:hypothetical protein